MNRWLTTLAACVLCLLLARPSQAIIAVGVAHGTVQSVSVSNASVTIAGKSYAITRDTVVVGAKSLGQITSGARVTAILTPDGKTVTRLILQPASPQPKARH